MCDIYDICITCADSTIYRGLAVMLFEYSGMQAIWVLRKHTKTNNLRETFQVKARPYEAVENKNRAHNLYNMNENIAVYPDNGDQKLLAIFEPRAFFTSQMERLAEQVNQQLLEGKSIHGTLSPIELPDWCQEILREARFEYNHTVEPEIVKRFCCNKIMESLTDTLTDTL